MDADLPLVVTGAGLSGCIGRWFVDRWPGPARFVGPARFLATGDPKAQLLVLSQSGSPHGRLAIRAGRQWAASFVCGSRDPQPLNPDARWIRTEAVQEVGLRIEGPLTQIEALQAFLPPGDETPPPEPSADAPTRPPVALLHDGRAQSALFAELTAWSLLERLGACGARAFELLDFAHGGLQALPRPGGEELWLFGRPPEGLRRLVADAVSPHRLISVGASPDAWRTLVRQVGTWPQRPPFGSDGPLYALETPPSQ